MFPSRIQRPKTPLNLRFLKLFCWMMALGCFVAAASFLPAQDQSQRPAPSTTDNSQQKSTEAPPEAGGPQTDVGPYAIPKKKEEPPPPPPEKPKKIEGMPADYSIHVTTPPLVEVPVLVTTKDGQFMHQI